MAALLARTASRDLFDVRQLLEGQLLDTAKLRLAFVIYGGINRRDWREIDISQIKANPDEVSHMLLPMLRADLVPAKDTTSAWTQQLVDDCQRLLTAVLPLSSHEMAFLDRLNDHGEVESERITDEKQLQDSIRTHPGLR